MSDDMLHAILQMPPDLWSDREIWQRHGRYLEASERIMEFERERDEARRERDEALKEWDIAREGWNKALEERDAARRERDEARRDLVGAEELHRRRFQTLKAEYDAMNVELKQAIDRICQIRLERDNALATLELSVKAWSKKEEA